MYNIKDLFNHFHFLRLKLVDRFNFRYIEEGPGINSSIPSFLHYHRMLHPNSIGVDVNFLCNQIDLSVHSLELQVTLVYTGAFCVNP